MTGYPISSILKVRPEFRGLLNLIYISLNKLPASRGNPLSVNSFRNRTGSSSYNTGIKISKAASALL